MFVSVRRISALAALGSVSAAGVLAAPAGPAAAAITYRFDGKVVLVKDRFRGSHQGVAAVFKLNHKITQLSSGKVVAAGFIGGKQANRVGFAGGHHRCYNIPDFAQRTFKDGHRYTVTLKVGRQTLTQKVTMHTIKSKTRTLEDSDPYGDPVVRNLITC